MMDGQDLFVSDAAWPSGVKQAEVQRHLLEDDGVYPNNPWLPLLIYQGAFDQARVRPSLIEGVFTANHWSDGWRNGILGNHHYHSTAHEVLGCYAGYARVQFGGPTGVVVDIDVGDVVVLPAGTAHKNLGASADFRIVGCYPDGQHFNMKHGRPGERPEADEDIARVPLPEADPVYGEEGPLMRLWVERP